MIKLENVQSLCSENKIHWTTHAVQRMLERGITKSDVILCIMNGSIIEQYPDFWLTPACLICGSNNNQVILHVVVGMDNIIHIVTVYYPSDDIFSNNYTIRREQ